MLTALIQMAVTDRLEGNLETARQKLLEAASNGADIAVLPEMFCCPYQKKYFRACSEPDGGPAQTMLAAAAAEAGIYVVGGTLPEADGESLYNTSYVYDRQGRQIAKHRKLHLFDVDIPGKIRSRESHVFARGNQITTFETEFGTMGLCVCFDVRFQELFQCMSLRGAQAVFVPATFSVSTGTAHWELLLRSRAVDNQCFTVGVSPARDDTASYVSYGNSMAVDPWGTVLCRAGGEETTLYADLDLSRVAAVRQQLPILSARRTDLYEVREV